MPTKSWKNHPQKLLRITQIHFFFLTAWAAQTEEFMLQNVAYRPTVYRTGPSAILALWDLFDPVLPRMHLWDWINKAIDYHSSVPQWGQSFMMTNLIYLYVSTYIFITYCRLQFQKIFNKDIWNSKYTYEYVINVCSIRIGFGLLAKNGSS